MKKLLYIDTETTGLDAKLHGLTQIAALVVIDGEERDSIVLDINPCSYPHAVLIDAKALEITGKTPEQVNQYPDQKEQCHRFVAFCEKYVVLEDRRDQLQWAGYNTGFDLGFVKEWFALNGIRYSDIFGYKDVDVFALVKHMRLWGLLDGCKNDRLGTVCDHYGIQLDAHDAMNDIKATRELYHKLIEYLDASLFDTIEI